jgi:hypothetical protein
MDNQEEYMKMHMELRRQLLEISEQKEEIIRAFIAKYGCDADDIELVTQQHPNGSSWYIRRKSSAIEEMAAMSPEELVNICNEALQRLNTGESYGRDKL